MPFKFNRAAYGRAKRMVANRVGNAIADQPRVLDKAWVGV